MRAEDWIPANILAAAKRAGLSTPTWYVGRGGPPRPRKKTLDDLARESDRKIRERGL
jgi:lambda repressor-like predicted transcriptional regulator